MATAMRVGADYSAAAAEGLRRLTAELVSQLGADTVAEILGIPGAELPALLNGGQEWDEVKAAALERACAPLGLSLEGLDWNGDGSAEVSWEEMEEYAAAEPMAVDLELAPTPAEPGTPVGFAERGQRWEEVAERRRQALWGARSLAISWQFRMGMKYSKLLDSYETVIRLELALIMGFYDSVPEPGMNWDLARRAREIEKRMARLRWVERERNQEYSGVLGLLKKVVIGDRRWVSGKDLFERIVRESEAMVEAGAAPVWELSPAVGAGGGRRALAGGGGTAMPPGRSRDGSPAVVEVSSGEGSGRESSVAYPAWLLEESFDMEPARAGAVVDA